MNLTLKQTRYLALIISGSLCTGFSLMTNPAFAEKATTSSPVKSSEVIPSSPSTTGGNGSVVPSSPDTTVPGTTQITPDAPGATGVNVPGTVVTPTTPDTTTAPSSSGTEDGSIPVPGSSTVPGSNTSVSAPTPGSAGALSNPQILDILQKNPQILDLLKSNPQLIEILLKNPQLLKQ